MYATWQVILTVSSQAKNAYVGKLSTTILSKNKESNYNKLQTSGRKTEGWFIQAVMYKENVFVQMPWAMPFLKTCTYPESNERGRLVLFPVTVPWNLVLMAGVSRGLLPESLVPEFVKALVLMIDATSPSV